MIHGISGLNLPPGLEIREENISMIQTATKLAYGAAILVLSFLFAVPLWAEDASKVLSGVVINPFGAVRSQRQNVRRNDLAKAEIA
jgi:hypothetical protein